MLLKSINYWSFPGGLDGAYAVEACLEKAAQLGFEAVELCIGEAGALGLDADEDRCRAILRPRRKPRPCPVASVASGLYWGHALGDEAAEARTQAAQTVEKMIADHGLAGGEDAADHPRRGRCLFSAGSPRALL